MFNIGEIIEAWAQSYAPTPGRSELAKLRYEVCRGCEYFGKRPILADEYCKDCGCPLSKKVFSKKFNACPQKKWESVDKLFYKENNHKNNNTII
jgi:hypothetical protein